MCRKKRAGQGTSKPLKKDGQTNKVIDAYNVKENTMNMDKHIRHTRKAAKDQKRGSSGSSASEMSYKYQCATLRDFLP